MRRINKIIVHHTAVNNWNSQLEQINQYHKQRDFPISSLGYYVGYHYLIQANGKIIQTRSEDEIGAHDKGENYNSIGIGLEGRYNTNFPPEAQRKALGQLLVDIVHRHRLTALDIEPHRIRDNTDCYGTALSNMWASYVYIGTELNIIKKAISWILIKLKEQAEK